MAVVDTVGAGDSFTGSLLASLAASGVTDRAAVAALDPADVVEMGERACRVAALTCERVGADPPTGADLAAGSGEVGSPPSGDG